MRVGDRMPAGGRESPAAQGGKRVRSDVAGSPSPNGLQPFDPPTGGGWKKRSVDDAASVVVFYAVEAVHAQRPLPADDGALDARQEPQREQEREGRPDRGVDPERRQVVEFQPEHERHDDVADDHDGEIGGRVVRLVMEELLAAIRAGVGYLEELVEDAAAAAGRAKA